MIAAAFLFIWNTLKAFVEILKESPIARYFTFGLVVAVLVGGAILCRNCDSRLGKQIDDRAPVIVEEQQGVNAATNQAVNANKEAVNAGKDANQALANVNAIRKDKKKNVSIEEANRNRCIAFPESEECK
jgi:hypothetical protein